MFRTRLRLLGLLLGSMATIASAQQTNCNAPLGWWESKGLNPLFINPDGPSPATDCDFQVWSWTAFVHWMQNDPTTGQPMFLGLPTPADLNSGTAKITGDRKLLLQPRTLKPDGLGGEIQQAGSNGILVDQAGRVVYYSVHLDPIYFAFAQQYYGPANYQKAAADLNFPIGATVLKASWRVMDPSESPPEDAFVTPALIAQLQNGSGGGVQASSTMIPANAVLVGVHVVGVIKDHPEFAWGTFEHVGNAPNLPTGMSPKSASPVSTQSFAFYKGGTAAQACNAMPTISLTSPPAQTATPISNVFRQFQYGGATPDRVADIVSSNKNFRSAIAGQSAISKVFANYNLVGTVWQKANTLQPNDGSMDSTSIGSPQLANSTMETFVQGTNCFSCHNTAPGKNIDLSHILLHASGAKAAKPAAE